MSFDESVKEEEIELSTIFSIPENICYINFKGKILAIAVDIANWIVLDNDREYSFFKMLKEGHSIQDALIFSHSTESDISNVLIQIIAKDFCNHEVKLKNPGTLLQIYLTNACNMRCPHCYMHAGIKKEKELSFKEIRNLIDKFAEHHGEKIIFTGGEVSLRDDLKSILSVAKSHSLKVEVLSNGVGWNSSMYEWAAELIDEIQISIDGYNEKVNSKIRGEGNFRKALLCVEELINHGVNTRVAITPPFHDKLHEDILQYCNFAKTLNEKMSKNFLGCSFSGELMEGREIKLTKKQQEYYKSCIEEIESRLYGVPKYQSFIETIKQHIIADNCAYGQLSISSDGNVFLCPKITDLKSIGNIRDLDLDWLFEFSKTASEKSNIQNLKPCNECELKFICGGDCRINHFSFLKDGLLPPDDSMGERVCTKREKNKFYEMMIATNELIYQ